MERLLAALNVSRAVNHVENRSKERTSVNTERVSV